MFVQYKDPVQPTSAHLPPEIIQKMFGGLRGNALIKLTTVCKSFNETIANSAELMNKIRLKVVPSNESRSVSELDNVLKSSERSYSHISLSNTQCDNEAYTKFFTKYHVWKSLKLSTCHFDSVDSKARFLTRLCDHLEEMEFENVIIDNTSLYPRNPVVGLQIPFPKLQKLKCGALPADFVCTALKALDLSSPNQNGVHVLLKSNPELEDLTITFDVLDFIFRQNIIENGIILKLKKFHVHRHHTSEPMDSTSSRNFQTFLKSQVDCLEEVQIEWYSGRPPARKSRDDEWGEMHRLRRRGNDNNAEGPGPSGQNAAAVVQVFRFRRHRIDIDFNAADDVCLKSLGIIFKDFTKIRKLIISDKHGYLCDTICPSATALLLEPNYNITELRLRFEKAPVSDLVFEKIVTACPNIKSLFVHEMDQKLLEICSRELLQVESIFALSFKVDQLSHEAIKFEHLNRINFCECIVKSRPELGGMKSAELKAIVIKMLKQEN